MNVDRFDECALNLVEARAAYSATETIIGIVKDTARNGISKEDALTFDTYIGKQMLGVDNNFGGFTSVRTKVGVNLAMESFFKAAGDALSNANDFAFELLSKLTAAIRKSLARKLVDAAPSKVEVDEILAGDVSDRPFIIARMFNDKYQTPVANYIKSNLHALGATTEYSDAVIKSVEWIKSVSSVSAKVAADLVLAITNKDIGAITRIHDEFINVTDKLISEGQMTPEIPSLIKVDGIGLFSPEGIASAATIDKAQREFIHAARAATQERYDFVVEAYTDDVGLDTASVSDVLLSIPTRDSVATAIAAVDAAMEDCENALNKVSTSIAATAIQQDSASKLVDEFFELADKFNGIRVRLMTISTVTIETLYMLKDITSFQSQVYSTTHAMRSYLENTSAFTK